VTDNDENLERALNALRAEYLSAAPERLAELWSSLARVQNGDATAVANLGILVHRLAGSAGGYGFEGVSRHAREADQLCRVITASGGPPDPAQLARLKQLVQAIADDFASASAPE
jgi:HPt (histidine-containing phosphotransfer) domain-containing protein